jgi:holo-[acyl-carrier protein] synthase
MGVKTVRLGIDLVPVKAIETSIASFGNRFLERVFTPAELMDCGEDHSTTVDRARLLRLAARFAAKEAVMKVLGSTDQALPWRSIEIRSIPGGGCRVELHREADALATSVGIHNIAISITHEQDYAAAVAASA